MSDKPSTSFSLDEQIATNNPQSVDVTHILFQYYNKIQWKKDKKYNILDVGCGDGGLTSKVIYEMIPPNFEKLYALDVNEQQLIYAESHNQKDRIEYILMDITADYVPKEYHGKFDHIVSFNVLHWIKDHGPVLKNIHTMLDDKGDVLLMFMAQNPCYQVFINLAAKTKWSPYMTNIDEYVPNYIRNNPVDFKSHYNSIMAKSPFKEFEVSLIQRSWTWPNSATFRRSLEIMSLFELPEALHVEFYDDVVAEAEKINCLPVMDYILYAVYARKD